MELHVFCDASLEATAAVAYIKTNSNQGTTIRFLMGKTRVAPLRRTTTSRLELQAALYAARLSQVTRRQPIDKDFIDANTFSQWLKLRAVIIKIKNLRNKTKARDQQIIDAENFLFRLFQQQSFDEDVNQLTHIRPVQKRSRLIQLTPSIDEDGIIRSNSRLANAPVSTATKKPIILDGRNRIIRFFSGTATQHKWTCWSRTANTQHSVGSSMQNGNEEDLK